ncbi:MAG TPA: antibiotic biosynthesis monooxygenase [Flavobacteriales bacterium]|nr:antibiotic biosynthesis monooxygenase [Flavobacteriales bacterium]
MIVRIVHMEFHPEKKPAFLALFEQHKADIAAQPGCRDLKLVQHEERTTSISTVSTWDSQEHLDAYRKSTLFAQVWPATKALFSAAPTAESRTVLWAS